MTIECGGESREFSSIESAVEYIRSKGSSGQQIKVTNASASDIEKLKDKVSNQLRDILFPGVY